MSMQKLPCLPGLSLLVALTALAAPPQQPTLDSPAMGGQLSDSSNLQFAWTDPSQSAIWSYVWISRNGAKFCDQWVNNGTTWSPPDPFPGGKYAWWVHPWNSDGYGPWSGMGTFTIASNTPGQVALGSPSGAAAADFTQTYTWQQDPYASWYELCVLRGNGLFLDEWFSVSQLNPSGGQLSIEVPNHKTGSYRWWVRGWSLDGMGPWSSANTFNIDLTSLNLNSDGSFNENGAFERVVHQPYSDNFNGESWSGTYIVSISTVSGTSSDGNVRFTLNLNATRSQVLSGTWTDVWDGNQVYQIYPNDLVRTQ
jgi:hypothetical protein